MVSTCTSEVESEVGTRRDPEASSGGREKSKTPTFLMHFTPWCSFFTRFSSVISWPELSLRCFHFRPRLACSPIVACAWQAPARREVPAGAWKGQKSAAQISFRDFVFRIRHAGLGGNYSPVPRARATRQAGRHAAEREHPRHAPEFSRECRESRVHAPRGQPEALRRGQPTGASQS